MSDPNTSVCAEPGENMLKHELSLEQRVLAAIDAQIGHCLDCTASVQLAAVRRRVEEVLFTPSFRQCDQDESVASGVVNACGRTKV